MDGGFWIHKARIRKNVATVPLGKGANQRHVAPGNNHHMEIVARIGPGGEEKGWDGLLVHLLEAARRVRSRAAVVRRDHGSGKSFKFSLAGGEYVEMEHESGQKQLFRVVVLTDGQVEFRLHTDGRPITVLKQIPGARVRRSPGSLLRRKHGRWSLTP